ncbi:MAG: flagellar export protein FliJ [Xanthomonadaceae bacterium]|nr:flagellar export protein FliJ [Xanthomonadaceae bacterium]
MTRSKRMTPVVKVAENREQAAARILGEARQRLEQQQRKLDELGTYRDQYSSEFQQRSGQGMGVACLQDFRVFLARLNEAIEQQQRLVERCRQESERQRLNWLSTRTRTQALGKVVDRYRREERHQAERREQLDTDERALRARRQDLDES